MPDTVQKPGPGLPLQWQSWEINLEPEPFFCISIIGDWMQPEPPFRWR